MKLFLSWILFACLVAGGAPAVAGPLKVLFDCEEVAGGQCVVKESPGGQMLIFQDAAQEVLRLHIEVVFEGACSSACTLFADLIRRQACTEKSATFGFHKFTTWPPGTVDSLGRVSPDIRPTGHTMPPYSAAVASLIRPFGDLPESGPLLVINSEIASQVWPRCAQQVSSN